MFAKTLLTTALAAAAVLGTAATALAAPSEPETASRTVHLGDLNLSGPDGAGIALRRIQVAAASVCGGAPDPRLLDRAAPYRACVHGAVDRAVAFLDRPIVTAQR